MWTWWEKSTELLPQPHQPAGAGSQVDNLLLLHGQGHPQDRILMQHAALRSVTRRAPSTAGVPGLCDKPACLSLCWPHSC